MKVTVLVDNTALIDRYFLAEPALALHVEDVDRRVLFDAGYSEVLLTNADRMGVDLLHLDCLVLSHGHLDHTWGLVPLLRRLTEASLEGRGLGHPTLVAHPGVFRSRSAAGLVEVGSALSEDKLARHFRLQLSREPVWLSGQLVFLGEIPRRHPFEDRPAFGMLDGDGRAPDFLVDDSALAWRGPDGLVIITGCAHSGICNIIDHAREVCCERRVVDIIGGLHLLDPPARQLAGTVEFLARLAPKAVHACHCTDLRSKVTLSSVVNLLETGVGLALQF